MDLNTFGAQLLAALARIAGALENGASPAATTAAVQTNTAPVTETAAAKKKRLAEEAAAKAASEPKVDRPAVNKALVAVKDSISKEAAQAIFKAFGYEAMSKIDEKDFVAVLAAAEQELAEFTAKTGKYAEDAKLDEDGGDDDL